MIVTLNGLAGIRARYIDKKIVLTSGTFDLFHVGHLRYLNSVKTYGDVVIVMLSGDDRIRARKGLKRPIIPEADRAQILDALKVVDYVFIDPSELPPDQIDPIHAEIVARLQPDMYVTDGDDIRFSSIMAKSKLAILPRADSGEHASTTAIIAHIVAGNN